MLSWYNSKGIEEQNLVMTNITIVLLIAILFFSSITAYKSNYRHLKSEHEIELLKEKIECLGGSEKSSD